MQCCEIRLQAVWGLKLISKKETIKAEYNQCMIKPKFGGILWIERSNKINGRKIEKGKIDKLHSFICIFP